MAAGCSEFDAVTAQQQSTLHMSHQSLLGFWLAARGTCHGRTPVLAVSQRLCLQWAVGVWLLLPVSRVVARMRLRVIWGRSCSVITCIAVHGAVLSWRICLLSVSGVACMCSKVSLCHRVTSLCH